MQNIELPSLGLNVRGAKKEKNARVRTIVKLNTPVPTVSLGVAATEARLLRVAVCIYYSLARSCDALLPRGLFFQTSCYYQQRRTSCPTHHHH